MKILFIICQWTWGFIQSFIGLIIYLLNINKEHFFYHGVLVTKWHNKSSVSLGFFIFISKEAKDELLIHEYGHSIQSLILGPLYLLIIGLPSFIWANMKSYRLKRRLPYDYLYTEKWANTLGRKVIKDR